MNKNFLQTKSGLSISNKVSIMQKTLFTLLFSVAMVTVSIASPVIRFVNASTGADGTGGHDGTTWAKAYASITKALADVSTGNSLAIYVKGATGVGLTYTAAYTLPTNTASPVYIKGGYPQAATASDTSGYAPTTNVTLLTNPNSGNIAPLFKPAPANSATLAGLYLVNCAFPNNQATAFDAYSQTFTAKVDFLFIDLVVSGNLATNSYGVMAFKGLISASTVSFKHCFFGGTTSTGIGSGSTGNANGAIVFVNNTSVAASIDNCAFSYNTFVNSSIPNNGGNSGSGVDIVESSSNTVNSYSITNSTFCHNTANNYGAAIQLKYISNPVTIANCNFALNSSQTGGGAIYLYNSVVNCTSSNFFQNSVSSGNGGAIDMDNNNTAIGSTINHFDNCYFYKNTSNSNGGGIEIDNSKNTSTADGSTFDQNTASNQGGAIMLNNSTFSSINASIFYKNAAGGGTTAALSDVYGQNNSLYTSVIKCKLQSTAANYSAVASNWAVYTMGSGANVNTFSYATAQTAPTYTCPTPAAILPVSLTGFTALLQTNNVAKLDWTTASESNNSGFKIEHSMDGINFSQVGFVATLADGGKSTSTLNYTYSDAGVLAGTNYYRLQQIDFDGNATYSPIVKVAVGAGKTLSLGVYPNPVSSNTKVVVGGITNFNAAYITITNTLGQNMERLQVSQGTTTVDCSNLPRGIYFIKYTDAAGNNLQTKVVR